MNEGSLKEPTSDTTFPVPWGLISGKWWGSSNQKPIICIHGWQDNAGTFDKLIPLLPSNFSYYCIDLPGHGRSSHLPEGVPYYLGWEGVILLRRIMKHYDWKSISIMGHSLGSSIGFLFAAVFPNEVDLLIALDAVGPTFEVRAPTAAPVDFHEGRNVDRFLHYDVKNNKDLVKNYEKVIDMVFEGHKGTIRRESCEILMIRGLIPHQNGTYSFSRDNRVKACAIAHISNSYLRKYAKSVKCRYLNIKTTPLDEEIWPFYKELLGIIERNSSDFNFAFVEGSHHVHLDYPERVAPSIVEFLTKGSKTGTSSIDKYDIPVSKI